MVSSEGLIFITGVSFSGLINLLSEKHLELFPKVA